MITLTDRQTQVLELSAAGATAEMIGRVLRLSEATVWTHIRHIRRALGVEARSRAALVSEGYQQRLLHIGLDYHARMRERITKQDSDDDEH